jgi:hypothetical protein
MFIQEHYKN